VDKYLQIQNLKPIVQRTMGPCYVAGVCGWKRVAIKSSLDIAGEFAGGGRVVPLMPEL